MKRLFLALLMQGMVCFAWAFDFEVPMQGYSLYFNIIDEERKTAEVCAPNESGTYRWTGHNAPKGVLDMPAEVEYFGVKYTVVSIGERAFAGCAKISGLTLPTTVVEIGSYAFSNCSGIKGVVTIGENVVSIGRSAFFGCSGITELVYNAVSCETMGGSRSGAVFMGCKKLHKLSFGNRVQRIPDYAFVGMNMVNSEWALPPSVEYIGEYAFAFCYAIKGDLRLPASVRTIGPYAFAQCHATTSLEIPGRVERIDQRAFYQCVNMKVLTSKAIVPPALGSEVFGGLSRTTVLNVPCISTDRYGEAEGWSKIRTIKAIEPCTVDIVGAVSNPMAGEVYGGGTYTPGDTVTLVAVCYAGYGFRGWSDGNSDNPRRVVAGDTATYTALVQPADVVRQTEYIHDTIYKDGIEVIYEYYEVNDVAEPIGSQDAVVYNADKRRLEVPMDKNDIVSVALYNDAGLCVQTGKPRRGRINMRRYPTGYYIIRITTVDNEQVLRFFHRKNK